MMAIGAVMYFLPTIIAVTQHRTNVAMIAIINVLLGWSFVGWIVALVMALTKEPQPVHVVQLQPVTQRPVPGHDLMETPPPE